MDSTALVASYSAVKVNKMALYRWFTASIRVFAPS